ncbi:hypothetical protein [Streptomyces sp. NBC_00996]|uniref:hypothetical protein n=1 Tax=Streptomyces sp. NBC_00996 TaxID=2903710 RepID=UPI0038659CF0|nr:hypothetical protein OG390_36735 [Streptomyces sp. NBC_00996]
MNDPRPLTRLDLLRFLERVQEQDRTWRVREAFAVYDRPTVNDPHDSPSPPNVRQGR